jgi:hypothetical protein
MTVLDALSGGHALDSPPQSLRKVPKHDGGAAEVERMKEWLKARIDRAKKEPFSEVVTLTPVLAKLLLENNPDNRPLSETQLGRLGRDLDGGLWEFNGESIIIAKTGELNNGQHRLNAVIATNQAIRVVMVFGVERKSRMTVDTGTNRTVAHFLGMNGHNDVNALAALANLIWMFKDKGRIPQNPQARPTKQQALHAVEHYSDLPDSISFASRRGVGMIASKALIAFVHYIISHERGSAAAEDFLIPLIDGDQLRKGDPVLYCRNRLIEMKRMRDQNAKVELIFRSWNFWRKNEHTTKIPLTGHLPKLAR